MPRQHNQQKVEPQAGDSPQVNERLWQAWLWKNRESDRIGVARRLKGLQIVLALLVVAAIIQSFTK